MFVAASAAEQMDALLRRMKKAEIPFTREMRALQIRALCVPNGDVERALQIVDDMLSDPHHGRPLEASAVAKLSRQLSFEEAGKEADQERAELRHLLEAVVETYCAVPHLEVGII